MKIMQFNQGLNWDMNNPMQNGFFQDKSEYNSAVNSNRIPKNFQIANTNNGLIPNFNPVVGYPYNIPVGINMEMNMNNVNKFNSLYGVPPNMNMNIAGFPMQNNNINNAKAQTAYENTVSTNTNVNCDKKNSEKNNNNSKKKEK